MEGQNTLTGIAIAVGKAGTQAKLAQGLGVSQQAVSQWIDQGWVPLRRAEQIENQYQIPRGQLANPRLLALLAPAKRVAHS